MSHLKYREFALRFKRFEALPGTAPEEKIGGGAARGNRLFLVARRRPAGGARPPVRRAPRAPLERAVRQDVGEDPALVAGIVGGDAQLRPVGERASQLGDGGGGDDSALVVARFRPRIGEQHEAAPEARLGERGEQEPRVVAEDPDIAEPLGLDAGEQPRDAVEEGLAADQAGPGMRARLGGEMLAGAEADLEPDRARARVEQRRGVQPGGERRPRDLEPRQQGLDQRALAGTEGPAGAPAVEEEAAPPLLGNGVRLRRRPI